jgi:hypothetical protein
VDLSQAQIAPGFSPNPRENCPIRLSVDMGLGAVRIVNTGLCDYQNPYPILLHGAPQQRRHQRTPNFSITKQWLGVASVVTSYFPGRYHFVSAISVSISSARESNLSRACRLGDMLSSLVARLRAIRLQIPSE